MTQIEAYESRITMMSHMNILINDDVIKNDFLEKLNSQEF